MALSLLIYLKQFQFYYIDLMDIIILGLLAGNGQLNK